MIWLMVILWFAFWNRARGSTLYGLTSSDSLARALSMGMFALPVGLLSYFDFDIHTLTSYYLFLWSWIGFFLWSVSAWEKYTSAAMGVPIDMTKGSFAPVDAIMKEIWPAPAAGAKLRLWGLIATNLRMFLAAPVIAEIAFMVGHPLHAWWALVTLCFGFPYYILAYIFPANIKVTMYAELTVGAMIGAISYLAL